MKVMFVPAMMLLAALAAQDPAAAAREEKGKFKLSYFGKEAGTEEYRLEEFENGDVVLFSKAKFDVEVQGRKQSFFTDTALTLGKDFAPIRYAALHKTGSEERQMKIEWKKGVAVVDRQKEIKTSAAFVLDNNIFAQTLFLLRRYGGGKKKLSVFNPFGLADREATVEEKGEGTLEGGGRSERVREYRITAGYIDLNVWMDGRKRILRIVASQMQGIAELEGFEGLTPATKRPEIVQETDVTFPSGSVRLAGSVTRPKEGGMFPAVVLLSDFGAQDRNGNRIRGKGGGERFGGQDPDASLFKAVAYALSERGVLVLRCDDRGCGKSEGDFAVAKLSDFIADAGAGVAFLRGRQDVGAVGLAGHGEGALIASLAAGRDDKIRAIFLMSAAAKPLDAIILDQVETSLREQGMTEDNVKAMLARQKRSLEEIKAAEGDYLDIDDRRTFIGWMREHFNFDPVAELRKVKCRVAILEGARDKQVSLESGERLEKARPGAERRRFDGLDHFFARASDPERRVDAEFLNSLAEAVVRLLK